jgi:hypothetical protein
MTMTHTTATDVWLPYRAEDVAGLPEDLTYRFWDGGDELPADPARCAFYTVPYMRPADVVSRPMPRMRGLRVVQTLSAGVDNVAGAVGWLHAGVALCNAKGVHEASTAELTLALILASLRGIPGFVRGQDQEEWRSGFYPALADKAVLIVGYGSIGSAIEDRLAGFECARITRVARSRRTTARGEVHAFGELPRLLPEADVVVVSVPLTEQTRGLADAGFLALMKDGALFVNVARGAVADTDALLAEVTAGGPAGGHGGPPDGGARRDGPGAAARRAPPLARARRAAQPPCRRLDFRLPAPGAPAPRGATHPLRHG